MVSAIDIVAAPLWRCTHYTRGITNDSAALAHRGDKLSARYRGLALDDLWYHDRATRAALTLEHSLGIGAFYAALCDVLWVPSPEEQSS